MSSDVMGSQSKDEAAQAASGDGGEHALAGTNGGETVTNQPENAQILVDEGGKGAPEASAKDPAVAVPGGQPLTEPDMSELKLGSGGAAGAESDGPVKLFVGGLAWETTEESLQRVFEKYGKIVEVSIMRHPRTFCSRGFGFVTLSSRSEAEEACNHKHTIDGRVVEAKISAEPGQNNPSGASQVNNSKRRKVFVGGLSADTTDEDFRKYFEQFGEISESQILQDHLTGRSRGFGFITFTDEATSEKVFTKGRFHELKGKLVEVKSATPRQQNKGGRAPRHHGGHGHGKHVRSGGPQVTPSYPQQVPMPGYFPGIPGYPSYPGYFPQVLPTGAAAGGQVLPTGAPVSGLPAGAAGPPLSGYSFPEAGVPFPYSGPPPAGAPGFAYTGPPPHPASGLGYPQNFAAERTTESLPDQLKM